MAPTLSLCMIVRNEAQHLARCLASVADLVDDIVVVDTGSTDGTQTIAQQHGARVIPAPWTGDFAAARNLSLEAAQGRWILVLDADEYLEPPAKAGIRRLIAGGPAAYRLLQKNTADGRTGALVKIVRLFPSDSRIRFEWPIHEQVAGSAERAGLPVEDTAIEIIHTGYSDPAVTKEKQRRNLDILQSQIAAGRGEPITFYLIGGACLDLGDLPKAIEAYFLCQTFCAPDSDLAKGARVRLATCLAERGRDDEALTCMPPDDAPDWHPELLILRGQIEERRGNPAAKEWFERTLACRDGAYVPPFDLSSQKARAINALAGYWKSRNRPDLAMRLLRFAVEFRKSGLNPSREMLHAIIGMEWSGSARF